METYKNDFICFINKIIKYDCTIKNNIVVSIHNGIITLFIENFFKIKKWITINQIEENTKMDLIWKQNPFKKEYFFVNMRGNKINISTIKTTKMHIVNQFMSNASSHFGPNIIKKRFVWWYIAVRTAT